MNEKQFFWGSITFLIGYLGIFGILSAAAGLWVGLFFLGLTLSIALMLAGWIIASS